MCSYCGCRSITTIARLTDEHTAIINSAGDLRRATSSGDEAATTTAARALESLLHPHTVAEERGLFAELRLDSEFTAHVDALCTEHHTIEGLLTRVSRGDLGAVEALDKLLRRHIDKEENGLFPAAAIALDGAAWDRMDGLGS